MSRPSGADGRETSYPCTVPLHGFIDRRLGDRPERVMHPGQAATLAGRVLGEPGVDGTYLVDYRLLVSGEEGSCVPSEATLQLRTGPV